MENANETRMKSRSEVDDDRYSGRIPSGFLRGLLRVVDGTGSDVAGAEEEGGVKIFAEVSR